MYSNLNAEMMRAGLTRGEVARRLGKSTSSLSNKLNGKAKLSIDEAFEISHLLQSILGLELPLEYLFEKKN